MLPVVVDEPPALPELPEEPEEPEGEGAPVDWLEPLVTEVVRVWLADADDEAEAVDEAEALEPALLLEGVEPPVTTLMPFHEPSPRPPAGGSGQTYEEAPLW